VMVCLTPGEMDALQADATRAGRTMAGELRHVWLESRKG
jgi:hypothetical protein